MVQLKARLFWLTFNAVLLIIVLSIWEPPRADGFVGMFPTVLNSTWYGPVLLLMLPVLMFWASLAVSARSLRIGGVVISIAALLVAAYLIVDSRQTTMFTMN